MDHILELLEKGEKSDKERYSWDYDKLENYLRNKYHFDFLDLRYTEEDYDDDHEWIRYFDNKEASRNVKIIFDKKNKKGYVYVRNKRIKKHEIPWITDYLKKRVIKHDQYIADYFSAFCNPRTEEFILTIFSKYYVETRDTDIQEILSNDKPFMESLKEVKDSFDTAYKRIKSYPDFVL